MSTLEGIVEGKVKAKHSENFFERTVRVSVLPPCDPFSHSWHNGQSINNGLIAVENYVVNHVKTVLFIGILLLIVFVQLVRKALSNTVEYADGRGGTVRYEKHGNGYLRKSNRMD